MHEIERKFLVTQTIPEIVGQNLVFGTKIKQCYLSKTGKWTVRVRRISNMAGNVLQCVQTMKRRVTDVTSIEFETAVSEDYFEMVREQCGAVLEKTRFKVEHSNHVWDVDYFPQYDGLIVAEIELKSEDEVFARPPWLGKEVTDKRYYRNRQLALGIA